MNDVDNDERDGDDSESHEFSRLEWSDADPRARSALDLPVNPDSLRLIHVNEQFCATVSEAVHPNSATLPSGNWEPAQACSLFALVKGLGTHRAITSLCRRGYGLDAGILLRSLFELALDSRYISQEPWGDRPLRWMDFDWVERYELDRRFPDVEPTSSADDPDSYNTIDEIQKQARRVQAKWGFWRKERDDRSLRRPAGHWSGMNRFQLAEEVGWESIYKTLYRMMSQTVHSSPRSANNYLKHSTGTISLREYPGQDWIREVLATTLVLAAEIVQTSSNLGVVPSELGEYAEEVATELMTNPER